jgi:hypothetical protein
LISLQGPFGTLRIKFDTNEFFLSIVFDDFISAVWSGAPGYRIGSVDMPNTRIKYSVSTRSFA